MNGRFSRLELGRPEAESQTPVAVTGEQIRGADDHFAQAQRSYRRGDFEPALQFYTRTLRDDKSRVAAWVGQVQMLVQLGEYAEARLWSDKALELFRNNGELLAAKAQACLRQPDARAALMCTDASIQSPGSSPYRWTVRGEAMLASAEPRARDCFEKALAEPGSDWFDAIVIARVYLFHRKVGAAAEFVTRATTQAPTEPYAWFVRAEVMNAFGNLGHAREAAARAIELDPRDQRSRQLLTRLDHTGKGAGLFRKVKGWFGG